MFTGYREAARPSLGAIILLWQGFKGKPITLCWLGSRLLFTVPWANWRFLERQLNLSSGAFILVRKYRGGI